MTLNTERAYEAMECAYRNGVMEKAAKIMTTAMQEVMEKNNLSLYEFINKMDEMQEEKLLKMEKLLQHSNLLFRLATSNILMKIISRLLDFRLVKRIIIWIAKIMFNWMMRTSPKAAVGYA